MTWRDWILEISGTIMLIGCIMSLIGLILVLIDFWNIIYFNIFFFSLIATMISWLVFTSFIDYKELK